MPPAKTATIARVISAATLFALVAMLPASAQVSRPDDVKVQVNYINVCAPGDSERQEIASALARIPKIPKFDADFEIARGHTTDPQAGGSAWVRLRRELSGTVLSNAQYSISVDSRGVTETTVFRWRDPREVLQVSIEDSASAGGPAEVLAADTPASHIRVERFGKNSLAVARCANTDQAALEPLFASASAILKHYRAALGVRQTVPGELSRLGVSSPAKRQ